MNSAAILQRTYLEAARNSSDGEGPTLGWTDPLFGSSYLTAKGKLYRRFEIDGHLSFWVFVPSEDIDRHPTEIMESDWMEIE